MKTVSAFLSGFLFAAGLLISGMTQPANIVGFLDFSGDWKPALALVMLGAVAVYAAFHRWVLKRRTPLFAVRFELPDQKKADFRLIAGSAAFGAGWGLGGFCPGPAMVALGSGAREVVIFFAAMVAGMLLYRLSSAGAGSVGDDRDVCG